MLKKDYAFALFIFMYCFCSIVLFFDLKENHTLVQGIVFILFLLIPLLSIGFIIKKIKENNLTFQSPVFINLCDAMTSILIIGFLFIRFSYIGYEENVIIFAVGIVGLVFGIYRFVKEYKKLTEE